jgi:SAM-dependent methyltransferase
MHKPFAASAEQNKEPILRVLLEWFDRPGRVLEVGSGTGQHAVHFAARLPHLVWQPSEVAAHVAGVEAWRLEAGLDNLLPTQVLDVRGRWPQQDFDYVFTANTAHIMHWPEVLATLAGVGRVLRGGGVFAMYGPFSVGGQHTGNSNVIFDQALRQADPGKGVRDVDDLRREARRQGLLLAATVPMPAENLTLIWHRSEE